MSQKRFPYIMAMLMALSPFAIDAYLPSMPLIAEHFSVSAPQIAITISIYIIGLACGQLITGPLADRWHKPHLILIGLSLFAISSFAIVYSSDLTMVKFSRFFQGFGGGVAAVCIPALIRERATGNEAAKLFSLIGLIMVSAPAIAPTVGTFLMHLGGWQAVFYFLSGYALIAIVIASFNLESRPKQKLQQQKDSSVAGYLKVLKNRGAMRYLLIQGLAFSIMMVFLTNASFIYQEHFQLSEYQFSFILSANVLFMAIFNRLNRRRLNHSSAQVLLKQTLTKQFYGTCILLILLTLNAPLAAIAIVFVLTVGAQGAISPNTNAIYISMFNKNTGSASALIGSFQFLIASLVSAVSTLLHNGTLWPPVLLMFVLALITTTLSIGAKKPEASTHKTE